MILVVDDHEDTRRLLERLLRLNGFDAAGVASSDEAIEFLRNNQPEAIILDDMMPGRSGIELLRLFREDATTTKIPIVMYSANAAPSRHRLADQLGAAGWITKGVDSWAALFGALCQVLRAGPGNAISSHPLSFHAAGN